MLVVCLAGGAERKLMSVGGSWEEGKEIAGKESEHVWRGELTAS